MDTFRLSVKSVHKTVGPRQFCDTWNSVSIEVLRSTSFLYMSIELPRSNSFVYTTNESEFKQPKSVHKTAKVRSFCGFGLLGLKSVHKTA